MVRLTKHVIELSKQTNTEVAEEILVELNFVKIHSSVSICHMLKAMLSEGLFKVL